MSTTPTSAVPSTTIPPVTPKAAPQVPQQSPENIAMSKAPTSTPNTQVSDAELAVLKAQLKDALAVAQAIQAPDAGAPVAPTLVTGDITRPTSPEVYDPRKRTFLEAPKIETCPHCGQLMQPKIKQMRNVMNKYVNAQGVELVINDDAPTKDIKGVLFTRVDGKDTEGNHILATKPKVSGSK